MPETDRYQSRRSSVYGTLRRLTGRKAAVSSAEEPVRVSAYADFDGLQRTLSVSDHDVRTITPQPEKPSHFGSLRRLSRRALSSKNPETNAVRPSHSSESSTSVLQSNLEHDLFRFPITPDSSSTSISSPESLRRLSGTATHSVALLINPPNRNMYSCSMPGCNQSFSRFFQLKTHTVQTHGMTGINACLRTNIEGGYRTERSDAIGKASLAAVQEAIM